MNALSLRLSLASSLLAAAIAAHGQNLITNGDFEAGKTGFTSDYAYFTTTNTAAAQYTVGTNPHAALSNWSSFGDHTTGTGKMMIVNGGGSVSLRVWQNDAVTLSAGIYTFSFFGTSNLADTSPANLEVYANSVLLGTTGSFGSTVGFKPYTFNYVSTGGSTTFVLRDIQTAAGGNDFSLDDISLVAKPVPEPATCAALGLGALGLLRRRRKA